MRLRLIDYQDRVRSSLWFIPSILVAVSFVLAEAALRLDQAADWDGSSWFLFGGGTESARAVVQTIATSMLTFTGLVFTVTMLVLQLASNQLSPRIMRTFLRDRSNQFVLGVFVATFVYSLLVLRRITNVTGGEPFVPSFSVWIGLVMVLFCIGLFIYYIHHMAQSIRPSSVMARVAEETHEEINHLYPSDLGSAAPVEALPAWPATTAIVLSPGPSGVLTGIDEQRIIETVRETGSLIELRASMGDFVREGSALFRVSGDWNEDAAKELQQSVHFGIERTMSQDAAFGFRQLVDVGQRALSPGINDPSTAVQAIDQLHSLLGHLLHRDIPTPHRRIGDAGYAILPRPSWADFVVLSCDEIRDAGRGQIQVQRRLRAMLLDLLDGAPEQRAAPVKEQLDLLDEMLASSFSGGARRRAALPCAQGHGPLPPKAGGLG
jgi:uncharacterized membrane protein